jgi:hypothetical protein
MVYYINDASSKFVKNMLNESDYIVIKSYNNYETSEDLIYKTYLAIEEKLSWFRSISIVTSLYSHYIMIQLKNAIYRKLYILTRITVRSTQPPDARCIHGGRRK